MLNQEHLYQLIFAEEWTDILKVLHKHKVEISSDALLQHAASIFENEFFRKIDSAWENDKEIEENLETLYILHAGNFYKLSGDNYRQLIVQLVKRKPLHEAYNFASLLPDEQISKDTIKKYEAMKDKDKSKPIDAIGSLKWIQIYNRLFDLINEQSDTATYFSGSRFINTVREFKPYFPDYTQYIASRNAEGKSTSRKIFYYDILLELPEETSEKVIDRILEIVEPFKTDKVQIIKELLGKNSRTITIDLVDDIGGVNDELDSSKKEDGNPPVVFISYSWDDEGHKAWVLALANRLRDDRVDVILDQYYLRPGKSIPLFVENAITRADRIIIVYTPNYKLKADKRQGGVGYEYSIINADLYKSQATNEKVIPVLRSGTMELSIPTFMQQFIHLDISNDLNFDNSYNDLLREIYNEPTVALPKLGTKPQFN